MGQIKQRKMPMAKLIWDEAYWLSRAEEARAVQDGIRNHECKRIMGEIAESYAHFAELSRRFRIAARDKSLLP